MYWNENDILNNSSKSLYYSDYGKFFRKITNKLNSNENALNCLHVLSLSGPVINLIALSGISGIFENYIKAKSANAFGFNVKFRGWIRSFFDGLYTPIQDHNPFPVAYKNGYNFLSLFKSNYMSLGDKYILVNGTINSFIKNFVKNKKIKNGFSSLSSGLIVIGFQAYLDYRYYINVKKSIEEIMFLSRTTKMVKEGLSDISSMLKIFEKFSKEQFTEPLSFLQKQGFIKTLDIDQKNFRLLLKNLASETFDQKEAQFYNFGRMLNTHRLMNELKHKFVPLLQNIALLGGYRLIAKMIRDHKNSKLEFSFSDTIEPSDSSESSESSEIINPVSHPCKLIKPNSQIIQIKNMWAPIISEDLVVVNDCNIGVDGFASNCVITGPNGGGKTSYMETVAINILFSRLGFVAGKEAKISNFSKILTSMRPAQDIQKGLSSFMAEHKRIEDIKNEINSCKGNIFVLLDEPYKGTVELESASRIYKFGEYIESKCKNCVMLMATHLRKPIELEANYPIAFKNYQMGYIQNEDNTFIRTFKILEGPAIWWFDDADKRCKFIDWLCDNAI